MFQRGCRAWGNLFTLPLVEIYWRAVADVAELADALDSKSGTRESVWVRPPPSAPVFRGLFLSYIYIYIPLFVDEETFRLTTFC